MPSSHIPTAKQISIQNSEKHNPLLLGLRETPQKIGTCTQEAPQFKTRPRTGVSINVENKVLNLSVNLTPKIVDWPMKNPGHSHRIW